MATITFMGREYKTQDLQRKIASLASHLAKNARLLEPLPSNTDLSNTEQKEIQDQIHAMVALPPFAVEAFWSAFAAHHLGQLGSSLRTLSLSTQRAAVSTLIQILSLMPDPNIQPYFRTFLQHSALSHGLPTLIAVAFVQGIAWQRPSGPGHICTLIINLLLWCDFKQGDDGKASIDAEVRRALFKKLKMLMISERFSGLEQAQQKEVQRLSGILNAIGRPELPTYISSTQQHLQDQLNGCKNSSCDKEAELTCARCKSVRYCGRACQSLDWKNGHKLRCFQAAY